MTLNPDDLPDDDQVSLIEQAESTLSQGASDSPERKKRDVNLYLRAYPVSGSSMINLQKRKSVKTVAIPTYTVSEKRSYSGHLFKALIGTY